MDTLTLDQLLVFVTAADTGSFSAASRSLNRSQTAITYTVHRLEEQIGAPLFDRAQYRPSLTSSGQALLPRARSILASVGELHAQARGLAQGIEPEVRLGLSELASIIDLAPTLTWFRAEFPTVALQIVSGAYDPAKSLLEGGLDLAILVGNDLPKALERNRLSYVDLVAVAAPTHPLAGYKDLISPDLLRSELQIVLSNPGDSGSDTTYGVVALDSWRVNELNVKRDLLCCGVGWGSMPRSLVSADIAQGRLVVLPVERWDGSDHLPTLEVVVARSRGRGSGPAGAALFTALSRDAPRGAGLSTTP